MKRPTHRPRSSLDLRTLTEAIQPWLLWSVYICLVLVLLTPFIVAPTLFFPFVVGKALFSRTVIAVMACLWTVLMLLAPAYRPPRSTLLALLGVGLLAYAVAAFFGVSPTRSAWSTYERMQGLVDAAHWFAFFVVAVSVLRDAAGVRALWNANLGVGLVIGCLAVVGYFIQEVPFYGAPERDAPRIGSVFGNATYLAAYATTNIFVAAGFLARSLMGATRSPMGAASANGGDGPRRGDGARGARANGDVPPWLRHTFYTATALTNLLALIFSGSVTALVGLAGGLGFLVVAAAFFAGSRGKRRLALLVGVLGGTGGLAAGALFFFPSAFPAITEATLAEPLVQRLVDSNATNPSFVKRRLAWGAGIEGFLDKPWLGWGPENYTVVFARYVTGIGEKTELHDYAHNKIIEEAATKGLLGLACHLALWFFAFYFLWRAARHSPLDDRVFVLFIGAALTAYFVQQLALVDTLTLTSQLMLLFAFVAKVETVGRNKHDGRLRFLFRPALPTTLRHTVLGVGGCALIALAMASLASNQAIREGAANLAGQGTVRPTKAQPMVHIEQAIADFEPLANSARLMLLASLPRAWRNVRLGGGMEAQRLLARAEREAANALAIEPENWQIHAILSKLFCVAARTEPGYVARAGAERAKALALAPNLDSFAPRSMLLHDRCVAAMPGQLDQ